MKILAISTSSNICSVALLEDNICIKELNICNEKTHSEKLIPLIEELFSVTGFSLADIKLICCDNGPGSFTGIRIGVATVKALAQAKNIPVVSCSSLEGLAYNVTGFDYICSILDARNNQVYTAIFDKEYNKISDYFADDINNLMHIFKNYKNIVFVGDGSRLISNNFTFDNCIHSKNIGICGYNKYKQGLATDADNLSVLYLRPSQAERLKKEKKEFNI